MKPTWTIILITLTTEIKVNKLRYYFYDTQTKLFCLLIVLLIISLYLVIGINFPETFRLINTNLSSDSIEKINEITLNISYSLIVSILTYFLTISIPTFLRLRKGYYFIHTHFKRQFIDNWVCLYCLLKYSLQVQSTEANNDPYVKMYEFNNLEQMKNLLELNEFQVCNNANNFLDSIEHFIQKLSSHHELIPSSLFYKINDLDSDYIPYLRREINLLDKNLTLSEVSSVLKSNIITLNLYFKKLSLIEMSFLGKKLMKQSNIVRGINLHIK